MALDTTQRKNNTEGSNSDPDLQRLRRAGWQLAGQFSIGAAADRPSLRAFARNVRALSDHIDKPAQWMSRYSGHDRKWMVDNFRLIRTARREVRGAADAYDNCRLATVPASSDARPLPYYVAAAYLRASMDEFTEEGFLAFLEGFQEAQPLDTAEIWALKPALQTQLLERIGGLQQVSTGGAVLVTSLRRIADSLWKNLVEASSYLNAILLGDPAGAFSRMDFESRDMYRAIVSDLARRATLNEREIAELVLELSRAAGPDRQRHVGYWLLDAGLPLLKHHIAYQPSRRERLRELLTARLWKPI